MASLKKRSSQKNQANAAIETRQLPQFWRLSSFRTPRMNFSRVRSARRRLVLVRALDEIGANRGHIVLTEHRPERRHARVLHRTVQHDLVEEIVADERGGPQVRNDAAADRVLAVTDAAVLPVQARALGDGGRGC